MKLEKILDRLNSLEKNSFIKIIDNLISSSPENGKEIEKLLSESEQSDLKSMDTLVISKIFSLVEREFGDLVQREFVHTSSQLDILTDIITRDGNCIMKLDWFSRLYENELSHLDKKLGQLETDLKNPKSEIDEGRRRDYTIYKSCVRTAFHNDESNNRDLKITDDELSILLTLSKQLELSQEEVKLINYTIVPVSRKPIDGVINELKNIGVIFYSKKSNTVYVADEIVRVLRKIRKKEVADKFFRRVLRSLREPQINQVCKKHNIDWKQPLEVKIKEIINEGISFTSVITNDLHKPGTSVSDKKKFINDLWSKGLKIESNLKGSTMDEKVDNLIKYFENIERDEKVGISIDGYEKLVLDLGEIVPELNNQIKSEFELQEEEVLKSNLLLDYNIKPRDILDIMSSKELQEFCKLREIKSRGSEIENILDAYKDSENLYLENFVKIGFRDVNSLKENGIRIKESELGIKFEELTKKIFSQLGFNVDESLRKKINTKKDKIDILLNIGDQELILVECKTIKESGFNKFSSVSRQMKSYRDLAKREGYNVIKSLLIAPEFSDDFINDTELEYDLNLSLIAAESLVEILDGFKNSKKHEQFPYKLLMRDVLIQSERIIKAIGK